MIYHGGNHQVVPPSSINDNFVYKYFKQAWMPGVRTNTLAVLQIKAHQMALLAKLILKTNKTILPDTPISRWLSQSVSSENYGLKQHCLSD